jgi:O-antigen/teichoic acid export membrane protein
MAQEEASPTKTIAKGAGILFGGMVISKIIFFVFRIFVARFFGPGDYGLFTLGVAIIGFACVFSVMGFPVAISRYISHNMARGKESMVKGTIASSLYVTLFTSVVVAAIVFLLSGIFASMFSEPMLESVIQVMAIAIPFLSLSAVLTSSFEGFKKIKYIVYTDKIFINASKLLFVIIIWFLGMNVIGIAISYTLAVVLSFILGFYFLEKRVYSVIRSKTSSEWMGKELLKFSLPLLFASLMTTIIHLTDTVMVGYFKDAVEVGIYNVAHPTAMLLFVAPVALVTLFLPVMTELYAKRKKQDLEITYKTVTKWIFYINLPFFLVMAFFSRHIIGLFFGPAYVTGHIALTVLSLGFFVYGVNQTSYYALGMLKKTRLIFYATAVCAAINIALNWVLIPMFGISGAALASAVTFISLTILLVTFAWRSLHVFPLSRMLIKPIIVGIASMAVTYLVGKLLFESFTIYLLVIFGVVFLVLYALFLLAFGGAEKEDMEILRAIERKSGIRSKRLKRLIKRFIRQ